MTESTLDARDLRMGGRWSAGQRAKNAFLRLLVGLSLGVADRLPEVVLLACGRALGAITHALAVTARRRAQNAVARALPERDAAGVARASFVEAGRSLATCLLLRRPDVRALDLVEVNPSEIDALTRALGAGAGAIVVGAHLGPFELMPAAFAELGLRPAVVVRESYDPALDPVVDLHRRQRGVAVIHRGRTGAAVRIVRTLRGGRPLGMLPDLGGRVPSVLVRFLGEPRPFPVGPAEHALRVGAPVFVATLGPGRAGGPRYRLDVRPLPSARDELELTQCVAFALENAICDRPEAWLWMAQKPSAQSPWLEKNRAVC